MAVSLGVIAGWPVCPSALAVVTEGLFEAPSLVGVGLQIQPAGPFSATLVMPWKQWDQEWICTVGADADNSSSCLMKLTLNIWRELLPLAVGWRELWQDPILMVLSS